MNEDGERRLVLAISAFPSSSSSSRHNGTPDVKKENELQVLLYFIVELIRVQVAQECRCVGDSQGENT